MVIANNHYYIGIVLEARGEDLTDKDIVLFNGEYRSISAIEREGRKIRLSFNFLRKKDSWDMELTNKDSVYKLGVNRVTGLKGPEDE